MSSVKSPLMTRVIWVQLGLFVVCALSAFLVIQYLELSRPNIKGDGFANYLFSHKSQAQSFVFKEKDVFVPNVELYHPFPESAAFLALPIELIRAARVYSKSCQLSDFVKADRIAKVHSMSPAKLLIWHQLACGESIGDFSHWLERAPYLHPSGVSYVKIYKGLVSQKLKSFPGREDSLLHLSERKSLSKFDRWYRDLSKEQREMYLQKFEILSLGEWIVLAGRWDGSAQSLYIFSRSMINKDLKENYGLQVLPISASAECDFHQFELCFSKVQTSLLSWKKSWLVVLLSFALLYLLLVFLYLYLVARREKRHRDADQALLFQVISHEVRTPMTAIKLNLDGLRTQFDTLTESGQKSLMRILDSFYDLEKIITKTLQELKGENKSSRFDLVQTAESLIFSKYAELVEFESSDEPLYIEMPLFWFEVSLMNLINNALNHGQGKVRVIVEGKGGFNRVTVSDEGQVPTHVLKKSLRPFSKGASSKGLGLGLAIINRKIIEYGGQVLVYGEPTRFVLQFKKSGEE